MGITSITGNIANRMPLFQQRGSVPVAGHFDPRDANQTGIISVQEEIVYVNQRVSAAPTATVHGNALDARA
jgi:hypothetical protein